jgi:membrane protease YdiL (CAAX protease family)
LQQHAGAGRLIGEAERRSRDDAGLLPMDRTFGRLFPVFALPYAAYVSLGALPASLIAPEAAGALRFLIVIALLWLFRKNFRFGPPLTPRLILIGFAAGLAATALWVLARFSPAYSFSFSPSSPLSPDEAPAFPSLAAWALRAASSVLLVPIFEELFCRAYLGEFLYRVPEGAGSFMTRLTHRWDDYPEPLPGPPLSALSVMGCTVFFALGHDASAWAAAALYFGFTSWVYARTRSFGVCVMVHAMANFAIAALVLWKPAMGFLWK